MEAVAPAAAPTAVERALGQEQLLERLFRTLDCRTLARCARVNRLWRDAHGQVARQPQWVSTLSRKEALAEAVEEAAREAMSLMRMRPHACFVFLSAAYLDSAGPRLPGLAGALRAAVPEGVPLIGCTGTAIIGTEHSTTPVELEESDGPAVSVTLAYFASAATVELLSVKIHQGRQGRVQLRGEAPAFAPDSQCILLATPTDDPADVVDALGAATPGLHVCGGLASGSTRNAVVFGNASKTRWPEASGARRRSATHSWIGEGGPGDSTKVLSNGVLGLIIQPTQPAAPAPAGGAAAAAAAPAHPTAAQQWDTVVAPSTRPVGPVFRVTRSAEGNPWGSSAEDFLWRKKTTVQRWIAQPETAASVDCTPVSSLVSLLEPDEQEAADELELAIAPSMAPG